jgi:sec-independent protein translocase protein TatA
MFLCVPRIVKGSEMNFFGIGIPELLLILVIALVVFGPQRLPEIGRSIGKAVRDFREMSAGFTSEWQELSKEFEETASEVQREVKEVEAQIGEFESDIEKVAQIE